MIIYILLYILQKKNIYINIYIYYLYYKKTFIKWQLLRCSLSCALWVRERLRFIGNIKTDNLFGLGMFAKEEEREHSTERTVCSCAKGRGKSDEFATIYNDLSFLPLRIKPQCVKVFFIAERIKQLTKKIKR